MKGGIFPPGPAIDGQMFKGTIPHNQPNVMSADNMPSQPKSMPSFNPQPQKKSTPGTSSVTKLPSKVAKIKM